MTNYKIVLAEDHIPMRHTITEIIQKGGEMSIVGDAGDDLEIPQLVKQSFTDMVITDIFMPRLGGVE